MESTITAVGDKFEVDDQFNEFGGVFNSAQELLTYLKGARPESDYAYHCETISECVKWGSVTF